MCDLCVKNDGVVKKRFDRANGLSRAGFQKTLVKTAWQSIHAVSSLRFEGANEL